MPYIQKTTPPPNRVLSFSLKDFSGGINNRSDQLKDNQASDILNMDFADDTLMEKRKGQMYYDSFNPESNIIYIDEYKPYNESNRLIRATESKVYDGETVIKDVAGRINGINHTGKYFFVDGSKIYVYGKFPQATTTYEKVIGTANPDYMVMEIVSPADGHARLGTMHVQGVTNYDYTNKKIFYEPCENEFVDTFKGANKVPQGVRYVVSHLGRMYLAGDDKDDDNVFISDIRNPYYFPTALPIQIPPNSDKIMGMRVYDNAIVIGRKEDLHTITGNTNRPGMGVDVFQLRRINGHSGFASNDAVDIVHNYLFFIGSDGNAYALGNTRVDERILTTAILSQTIDLEKKPINFDLSNLNKVNTVFCKDKWYVNLDSKTLVYSYRTKGWTLFENINSKYMYKKDDKLIWSNHQNRTVTFSEDTYMDFGLPYECYWYSKFFDMNNANSFKQFRECFIVAHTFMEYDSTINLVFEIDYTDVKERAIIKNQITLWGKALWGDRLINRTINDSIPTVIGRRGRNIRFKLSNGYFKHGDTETYGNLEYYIGRKEGVLVYVVDEGNYYLYTKGEWKRQDVQHDLNQRMKIYQINGDYEIRGKR